MIAEKSAPPPAAPTPPPLRRNFSWTAFGLLVYSACNWSMSIVLAKLGSSSIVGQYALGVAISQPIIQFSQLSLRGLLTTDARHEYKFAHYFALRFLCTLAAVMVMGGVSFDGAYQLETALVILVTGIGSAFDSFSDIYYGLQQKYERMDRMAISMAAKGVLSLALLTVGFCLTHNIIWAIFGSSLASALIVLGYDYPNARKILTEHPTECIPFRDTLPRLGPLIWLALPMGITMLLMSVNNYISRYFIHSYLNESKLGIFAALSNLIIVGRTIAIALGQAALPRLSKYYAAGQSREFTSLVFKLAVMGAAIGLASCLVGLIGGRRLLSLLYTPEYSHYLSVFLIVLAAGGVSYVGTLLGYGITAARYFKAQAVWFGLVTLVAALTSWWLIPQHGMIGAAISALLASIAQVIFGLLINRHVLKAMHAQTAPKSL